MKITQVTKVKTEEEEKEEFFPRKFVWKGFPLINGLPKMEYAKTVPFPKWKIRMPDEGRTLKLNAYMKTPKFCSLKKLIRWNWGDLGALTIRIIGKPGSGKSNLLGGLNALLMGDGVICFAFNDRNFEAKHICKYGLYTKDGSFQPFSIDFWVPVGYQFHERSEFLWNDRENVTLREYKHVMDIIDSMRPYTMTVIYDEPFDQKEKLQLWAEFSLYLSLFTKGKRYMFICHELAKLFPENPRTDIYSEMQTASNVFMDYRRFNIGLFACYHLTTEVFFKFGMKFLYSLYKKPHLRRQMAYAELKAKNYTIQQCNVSTGGFYRKHTIGKFGEIHRERYMIYPHDSKNLYLYPELIPKKEAKAEKEAFNDFLELLQDPMNIWIWNFHMQGLSIRDIVAQKEVKINRSAVHVRVNKLDEAFVKCYSE